METDRREGRVASSLGSSIRPGRIPGGPVYLGPKEKPRNMKRTIVRLLGFFPGSWLTLVFVALSTTVSSLATLLSPYVIGEGIDTLVRWGGGESLERFTQTLWKLLFLQLAGGMGTFLQYFLMASVSQDILYRLREKLFQHMQKLPVSFFDSHNTGDLLSRMTNDIETVNMAISQGILNVLSSLIGLSGALVLMVYLSPLLTLWTLMAIPLGFFLTTFISKRTRRVFSSHQQALGSLNGWIEETVSGLGTVKAFTAEERVTERFRTINRELRTHGIWAQLFSGTVPPLMNLMNNLSFLLTAVAGARMVLRGGITLGLVASFLQYSRQFMRPLNEMANQVNLLQAALAGAERVFDILDREPERVTCIPERGLEDGERGEKEGAGRGLDAQPRVNRLVVDHLYFSYRPGVPVLEDICFEAEKGQTLAIVGPTGAGKTTLVNLLARFYEVDRGAILFDGQNTREIPVERVRRSLGIVLQDTYLFSASVRENIRYGRLEATDQEVEEAARWVEAEPFILRLPQGYDTVLTDEGSNISQGERQLISLARALLANPPILILDEATSNVDTRTELHIQRALERLRSERISIIIAHRLKTIEKADRILVFKGGKIVETGNHAGLLHRRGTYHELYHAQFQRLTELRAP